jgi:cyclase
MSIRLISRLDVKMAHLIKGVQMEGWRKVGDPAARAARYYADGADEIIYLDVVASLYQRNNLHDILREVASHSFVPITVGGGIDSVAAGKALMDVGADKLALNTAATHRPELLSELSDRFGSQAVVLNIEAKSRPGGGWTVMTDNGRNHTGLDAVDWAGGAAARGVGEILLTSIDRDGTRRGMDTDLIRMVTAAVDIPVIASGGCATAGHAQAAIEAGAEAIAIAAALHDESLSLKALRADLMGRGHELRPLPRQEAAHE